MPAFRIHQSLIQAPLAGARRLGIPRDVLLQHANLTSTDFDDDGSLSQEDYARLMLSLWQVSGDESMGLNPDPVPFGSFAMMSRSVISCVTLDHALRRAAKFFALLPQAPQMSLEKGTHVSRLIFTLDDQFDPDHFLSESLLAIWHRFGSWLIDDGIPLLKVVCPYPEPAHAHLYQILFATPIEFNATELALSFPTRVLQQPVAQNARTLQQFLQHSPADVLARPNPHRSVSARVRSELEAEPLHTLPDLEEMAARLSMSSATLRRRLREEDSRYQRLKDEPRQREAERLLRDSDLSIHDIAHLTGFTESSAFTRAFRQWTRMTPGQFRANRKPVA